MLFNSLEFGIFLPLVFLCYWLINPRGLKSQNLFLLLASYFFYACWDWRFLFLILASTIVDYSTGLALARTTEAFRRKLWLGLSIGLNLGILGFFKYYNFFLENFTEAFSFLGLAISARPLQIILPVGISFYTFQTLSYTIDIYRKKIEPVQDFIAFAGFVSFFPQLVAGPIERASNLLPQFLQNRRFDYAQATDGMRQILWGLFTKVVIADSCAYLADPIFKTPSDYSASTLVVGAMLFSFQIYGDFSGYSNIAIGTARLFGFNLQQNFAFPYFSRNIAEFWRRWHISLTSWFKDYLYIPLGGSRGGMRRTIRNVFIVFMISGFWHGARWNFLAWGLLHALYYLPSLVGQRNRRYLNKVADKQLLPSLQEFSQMVFTFGLVTFAWIFFRAEGINLALDYIRQLFRPSLFSFPEIFPAWIFGAILLLVLVEWLNRDKKHALEWDTVSIGQAWRWVVYLVLCFLIAFFMGNPNPFIYFQF